MANYSLEIKKSVAKDLSSLPPKDIVRLLAAIHDLTNNPRPANAKRLVGSEAYRLRQGNYRIIYEIHDQKLVVMIIKVGHRSSIYR